MVLCVSVCGCAGTVSTYIGQTALHIATACCTVDAVRQLLDAGCDINVQDRDGWTPLHVAVGAAAHNVFRVSFIPQILNRLNRIFAKTSMKFCSTGSPVPSGNQCGCPGSQWDDSFAVGIEGLCCHNGQTPS